MVFSDFFDEPKQPRPRPRFTPKEKDALYKHQSGKCNGCQKKFEKRNMAVDHIRPFSQDGGERLTNLQLLCTACNSLKGAGTMAELRKKLRAQGVVKPVKRTASTTGRKTTAAKLKAAKPRTNSRRRPTQTNPFDDLINFFSN